MAMGNEIGKFMWQVAEEKNGFKFGKPWRQSDKALGLVIPILREKDIRRKYKMIEETKKVNIEDTGAIDLVRVVNKDNQNVFIRGGGVLIGDTQERATVSGVIIMPNTTMEVEVECVHASRGIRSKAKMEIRDYAPRKIHMALVSRNQERVWDSVQQYSMSAMNLIGSMDIEHRVRSQPDDLVSTIEEVEAVKQKIEGAIKDIPLVEHQVGAIIFDSVGIVGFEAFDSTKSWEVLHKKVLAKYSDILQQEQEEPLFQLRKEVIPEKIRAFVESVMESDEKQSSATKVSNTMVIDGAGIIGEYAAIGADIIHVIAFKREKDKVQRRRNPNRPVRDIRDIINSPRRNSGRPMERYIESTWKPNDQIIRLM